MLVSDRKWMEAFYLLSLELTRDFFGELWIAIDNPLDFQINLRLKISSMFFDPSIRMDDTSKNAETLRNWHREKYGDDQFFHLSDWVKNVFFGGGSDRVSEMFWVGFPFFCVSKELGSNSGNVLYEKMLRVKNELDAARKSIDLKRGKSKEENLFSWDKDLIAKVGGLTLSDGVKFTLDGICVTASYNSFVVSWFENCSDFSHGVLADVERFGKQMAEEYQIPYPPKTPSQLLKLYSNFLKRIERHT